jgi:uncharacterized membrane protein (UPF0127 family)
MRIINRTRRTLVGSDIEVADTWVSRLRGYLWREEPGQGEGILLIPCTAIHTYGMGFELDVLFLSEEGRVLDLLRGLPPWSRTKRVQGALYVLEVPHRTIDLTGTKVGDLLTWQLPGPLPASWMPTRPRENGGSRRNGGSRKNGRWRINGGWRKNGSARKKGAGGRGSER